MNNRMLIIGGTSGLGEKLSPLFNRSDVITTSSKQLDVTNEQQVIEYFNNCPCGIVLNFAGVNHDGLLINQKEEDIDHQIDVNVKGFINILKGCIPHMRKNNWGRVITMSSIIGQKPIRGTSIYSMTKAATENLVKTSALENAKYNITVNALSLGYMVSDHGMREQIPQETLDNIVKTIPVQRFGDISSIYRTIEWLIREEYVTGASLPISGGLQI